MCSYHGVLLVPRFETAGRGPETDYLSPSAGGNCYSSGGYPITTGPHSLGGYPPTTGPPSPGGYTPPGENPP
ncbi:hypothetical protein Tco_0935047 [Tanacetum coccineum]